MEISYILNALRRYWWVVLGGVALGVLGLVALSMRTNDAFESKAVVLVVPTGATGNNDRYIASQLSILRSESFAQRVADRMDSGTSLAELKTSVVASQQLLTDVVDIVATSPTARRAQELAAAYVDEYFALLEANAAYTEKSELARLTDRLQSLKGQLADVDTKIADLIQPYLDAGSADAIPTADQIAPSLASERASLQAEYNQIAEARTTLEFSNNSEVGSTVIQSASLPSSALPASSAKAVLVLVAGILLGLVGAIIAARGSGSVLHPDEVGDLLGQKLHGTFPTVRAVRVNRGTSLLRPPVGSIEFADELCVMAERNAPTDRGLTVLVIGTRKGAGSTTIAAIMSSRFAKSGASVLLIDADALDPELSELFAPDVGISQVLQGGFASENAGPNWKRYAGSWLGLDRLIIAGPCDADDRDWLRRSDIAHLVAQASAIGEVVVFDGGAVLGSSSASHLARLVDVVVLAIPVKRQSIRQLELVGHQLQGHHGDLLLIAVPGAQSGRSSMPSAESQDEVAETSTLNRA